MKRMRGVAGAVLLAWASVPALAADDPARAQVVGRLGDHPGYGRIVFDLPAGASYDTVAEGSRLLVVFSGVGSVGLPSGKPRNVTALRADGTTLTLSLVAGSSARAARLGDRLVIDLVDPGKTAGAEGAAVHTAASSPRVPAAAKAAAPVGTDLASPVTNPTAAVAVPAPAPVQPELHEKPISAAVPSDPVKTEALPVRPVEGQAIADLSFVLPADATVGAAAFQRGRWALIVLDRRLPELAVPNMPGASVLLGSVSTLLQVPLSAAQQQMALKREADGWFVRLSADNGSGAVEGVAAADGVEFPFARPGRTVTVLDPVTGATLLVGTSLADGPGNSVAAARRGPEYVVLPTWLGVAVEPLSDREELRPDARGFVLRGGRPDMALANTSEDRRFDFPNEPVPALLNRLRLQLASAAEAPPGARSSARMAAAQAMLALGMGVEAEALLQQIAADDPQAAADARLPALTAMAAVLAERPDEAAGLDDTRLNDSAEIALWRGLRDAGRKDDAEAGQQIVDHISLARDYPEPLRRLIWAAVAEAAARSGTELPSAEMTPFAQALSLERQGNTDAAIAAWHVLANGRDQRDRVRAGRRAAELELASGKIDTREAAATYERLLTAWRGDSRELALRLRTAELQAASGEWRAALDLLRTTEMLFPDQANDIRRRKMATFEAMLTADGAGLAPMDVILLANDFADCVPDDGSATRLAALLADKLASLDLAARAIPVLQGLVKATAPGPARAEFGTRLAQMLLDAGDAEEASTALQASETPGLSEEKMQARQLLAAKTLAARGDLAAAVSGLAKVRSAAADDLRATLLAKSGDWRGALSALQDLAAKVVPEEGPLPSDAEAVLIREAAAAAQVPDEGALKALQAQLPRMPSGRTDLLRSLTESPITSVKELPRAATELALARNMPQQIQTLVKR